jgi:PPOX class probable F420-dependent enzyme
MRARVAAARVGRLGTVRADGGAHVVPCCFALLEGTDTVVSAVDGKPKSTLALQRLANVRANPTASLLVDHYDDDWTTLWWVRVDATARILKSGASCERALDVLCAKYDQYRRIRPPGPVLALTIREWRGWSARPDEGADGWR